MVTCTSALALVTCQTECNPITKSYVMTSGGSLHVNTTLTVGSQILDIFPKTKIKKFVIQCKHVSVLSNFI